MELERQVADLQRMRVPSYAEPVPLFLPFNWSGPLADLVGMVAGPGWFPQDGLIYRIGYRFLTPAAVTVEWTLGGAAWVTHTPSADTVQFLAAPYAGEDIGATVTSDAGAAGLTAFVFLR